VKRILSLLVVVLTLMPGCHRMHPQISGSGKIQTQTRELDTFNSISTEGAFDLRIVCQKPQQVQIEGDDNVLPLITTEVRNNVLHIKNLRSYSVSEPITLEISLPDLVSIDASGAGSISITGIKNEKFAIDARGAPSIRAAGETSNLSIEAAGAGKFDTHKLRAGRVTVNAEGVAQVEVYAAEQLDVTVSGPSRVIYEGPATVKKTVNGPGSVEMKESGGA
jgi:Putative auto-transporter adhesin, head GIN domain